MWIKALPDSNCPETQCLILKGFGVQLVAMHLLGDVPVVPVLGWIQDRVHNWR